MSVPRGSLARSMRSPPDGGVRADARVRRARMPRADGRGNEIKTIRQLQMDAYSPARFAVRGDRNANWQQSLGGSAKARPATPDSRELTAHRQTPQLAVRKGKETRRDSTGRDLARSRLGIGLRGDETRPQHATEQDVHNRRERQKDGDPVDHEQSCREMPTPAKLRRVRADIRRTGGSPRNERGRVPARAMCQKPGPGYRASNRRRRQTPAQAARLVLPAETRQIEPEEAQEVAAGPGKSEEM